MKTLMTGLILLGLTACGTNNPKPQVDRSPMYKFFAKADPVLNPEGNTCGDATGTIRLYENGVYGMATDSFGRQFKITGKVEKNGDITGGFAISIITAVDFTGKWDKDKKHAKGVWKDVYQCEGTWVATRVIAH